MDDDRDDWTAGFDSRAHVDDGRDYFLWTGLLSCGCWQPPVATDGHRYGPMRPGGYYSCGASLAHQTQYKCEAIDQVTVWARMPGGWWLLPDETLRRMWEAGYSDGRADGLEAGYHRGLRTRLEDDWTEDEL